jgi:hypothetical protein
MSPGRARLATRSAWLAALVASTGSGAARADAPPGYPEPVIQWGVQKGESCEDIAKAAYGDAKHAALVMRYNRVSCTRGAPLKAGLTLVLPAAATEQPTARIRSLAPSVRARPAGGGWADASAGQPLETKSSVQTLEEARADIQFIDRTRVFMAENTLVVIYGTAAQTNVSKAQPPPAIELESGEVRAALAALRGDSVDVAAHGGRVSASSRDTVIANHGDHTNVSVFDGHAKVESAGKSVVVPERFGTRFQASRPPEPPRPLPPAPAWQATPSEIVLAEPTGATIAASWKPVERARNYRLEIARDASFDELHLRAEVGADATSFRFERLPVGEWFVRVRAIDGDDFLGLASEVVHVSVVVAELGDSAGKIEGATLVVDPDVPLTLRASPGAELAIGDGAFSPLPERLDLSKSRPARLRLRVGGRLVELAVRYLSKPAPLSDPDPTALQSVEVLPPREPAPRPRALGVSAIPWAPGAAMGRWWSPLPDSAGWVSGGLGVPFEGGGANLALRGSATTHVGPVGLEASFESDDTERGPSLADVVWLGARARIIHVDGGAFELGPGLRLGAPTSDGGTFHAEAGISLGARLGLASLLGNVDFDLDGVPTPYAFIPNVAIGGALDPARWLRLFALVDGFGVSVPVAGGDDAARAGAGLSLGAEAGRWVFGGASVRVMPFDAPDAAFSAQLSVGVREEP